MNTFSRYSHSILAAATGGVLSCGLIHTFSNVEGRQSTVAISEAAPEGNKRMGGSLPTHQVPQTEKPIFGVEQYPANLPVEDRFFIDRLSVGGWWFAVFDGHGGWQCSEYSHQRLHQNLSVELANRLGVSHEENKYMGFPSDIAGTYEGDIDHELVKGALVRAFERTDRQYMTKVYGAFELGFGRDTRAGSCALGALVLDNMLFVANAGDSRAVLGVNTEAYERTINGKLSKVERKHSKRPKVNWAALKGVDLGDAAYKLSVGEYVDPEVKAALRERMLEQEYQVRMESSEAEDDDELDLVEFLKTQDLDEAQRAAVAVVEQQASSSNPLVTIRRILTGGYAGQAQKEEAAVPEYTAIDMSNDHNCRLPRERQILEREHPGEKDVVVCKNETACYIKGKLQPTRAFGDFYLKYSEFMRRPDDPSAAGRYIKPPYSPPYVKATPEVRSHKLRKGVDEFLVMGSDGLWDVLSSQEVVEICAQVLREQDGNTKLAGETLVERALERVAEKEKITVAHLKSLPQGRRRRAIHDDITVVVVDLAELLDLHFWG